MELSLKGSQISLATRSKPIVAAVSYPILSRPASANTSCSKVVTNRCSPVHRPLSADCKTLQSFCSTLRLNLQHQELEKSLTKHTKEPTSSDIYKFLLTEPIQRSWTPPGAVDLPTNQLRKKMQAKTLRQMNNENIEPVLEDCTTTANAKTSNINDGNLHDETLTPNDQSPLAIDSIQIDLPQHRIETVDSKSTEGITFESWFPNKSIDTACTKTDLPGRVSFSNSDVFHLESIACESFPNLESPENSSSQEEHGFAKEMSTPNRKNVRFTEKTDSKSPDYSIESKISGENDDSLDDNAETTDMFMQSDSNICGKSNSQKIIEDYKKEIENLNRRHELEMKLSRDVSPNEKSFFNDSILFTDDIMPDRRSAGDASNRNETTKLPTAAKLDVEPSSDVISNYLRIREKEVLTVKTKKTTITNTRKGKELKKPKSAVLLPKNRQNISKKKETMRKSKSTSCLRDDSSVDEFQMDKVVSWMSINGPASSIPPPRCESTETDPTPRSNWRDTPVSLKTDDEGNFSFEDQVEIQSNESTYDEIVAVIKEIEEDKKKNDEKGVPASKCTQRPSTFSSIKSTDSGLNGAETFEGSSTKIKEILSYLDTVDSMCEKTIHRATSIVPVSELSEISFAVEPDLENTPQISDLVSYPNHQLARQIVALSLRSNELSNAVQLSRDHNERVREDKIKAIRLERINSQNKLREQKKQLEDVIQRHQTFIEQLLKDKTSLCEKVEQLTRRITSQNKTWEHRLQAEVERAKETVIAGEKIRRERWVRENTKKIKELTVKGLETEINKMNATHLQEMNDLKRQHQQDVMSAIDETKKNYERNEQEFRESYAQDRETIIEKERNAIRERFERQMEIEQKTFYDQRDRLVEEFAAERERAKADWISREAEFEQSKEKLINEKIAGIEHVRQELQEKIKAQEAKHLSEVASITEQFEADFVIWKREFETAAKLREVERESAIREQCNAQRDRQIDAIVVKMDAEAVQNQQEFKSKNSRIKEKFEFELKELESVEHSTRKKYVETRSKLAEADASLQNCQASIRQLQIELNHSKKRCDELLRQREEEKDGIREEIFHEVKTVKIERDKEIQNIYTRVQQAIEKKDASVDILEKENLGLKERCLKLEAIIRQQRKDYCTK